MGVVEQAISGADLEANFEYSSILFLSLCEQLKDDDLNLKIKSSSSIGQHMRHVVEFYQCFFKDLKTSEICYDKRARLVELECSLLALVVEFRKIVSQYKGLSIVDRKLNLLSMAHPGASLRRAQTTLNRELLYLSDHTIHHIAQIKLIALANGLILELDDKNFSTQQHRASQIN